ncbi:MAG TPA: hypothetical protein VMC06_08330 [Opitutaceae bacterium]|nr:hypothetical protein [Opitutaceae bacterium]
MNAAAPISPNRLPVFTAARLGRSRHFPAVLPLVRVTLGLRSLEMADAAVAARGGSPSGVEAEIDAIVHEARRAADACALS